MTRAEGLVVTVRSSWAGMDGLPTAVRACVSAPDSMQPAKYDDIGVGLQIHRDDELWVCGLADEASTGGVDALVALDFGCRGFG